MPLIFWIYFWIAIAAVAVLLYRKYIPKKLNVKGKNFVITGASSGLGLAIAQLALDGGAAKVTLIARGEKGLQDAAASLKHTDDQEIQLLTADVTNEDSVKGAFEQIDKIDFLFPNAGFALPAMFEDTTVDSMKRHINVNYLGAATTTKYAAPKMNPGSHVSYSGSVCSLISFSGYAAYSPSKYALRGLADTLRNELKSQGISAHIAFCSSMDTPGFKKENEVKPASCAAIEGTAHTFTPRMIAEKIFRGIALGDYIIVMEPLVWFISAMGCGITQQNNIFLELLVAPFLPVIRFGSKVYIDLLGRKKTKAKTD